MSAASSSNPSNKPQHNLTRLPDVEIPSRRPINSHEPPIAVTRNWIAGDFTGLGQLAVELYGFAGSSNDEVYEVASYIERLIGDSGDWRGDTADAFRWSFGGDIMIANDLAQVAVAIGRVIENLANNLASLEAMVDNTLSPRIRSGDFRLETPADNENWMVVAQNLDGQPVIAPRRSATAQAAVNARSIFVAAVRKAKRLRREAATQLAVLIEPINKNLDLYTSPGGEQREREGRDEGPLRSDQVQSDQRAVNSLQQQFTAAVAHGGDSGVNLKDVNQALRDLGKFGGDAKTIGGVVADIKAMQHTGTLEQLGKAGGVAQQVSGVVRDLVIFLAAEPIK